MRRACIQLSRNELSALAVQAKSDDAALRRVIDAVHPFVLKLAGEWARNYADIEDFYQEGLMAMLRCVKGYDPKWSFLTYLGNAIKFRYIRLLQQVHPVFQFPSSTTKTTKPIAARASVLARNAGGTDDLWRTQIAENPPEDAEQESIEQRKFRAWLSQCGGRMGEIMRRRAMGKTLEEVAEQLGITKERVRQIQVKGMEKAKRELAA